MVLTGFLQQLRSNDKAALGPATTLVTLVTSPTMHATNVHRTVVTAAGHLSISFPLQERLAVCTAQLARGG